MPLPVDFNIYLITDRHQVPAGHTLFSTIEAALRGGIKAVQLREKDLSAAELLPLAYEIRAMTHLYGARLMINDHVDIALAVGADGVHLGGHSRPTEVVRRQIGTKMLIGVSTHNRGEILTACSQGADFVTFGPVYATPSKAAYGAPQGLNVLAEVCRNSPLPIFALGGINPERAAKVRQAGAYGIALISAIIGSSSPEFAAKAFSP